MLDAFKRVARAARGDASVLILGENGTGKERVARALHEKSDRADQPFVAVNIAVAEPRRRGERAVRSPSRRVHRRAAPTAQGLFEQAHGGTLFLDEIGDLDPQRAGEAAARDPGAAHQARRRQRGDRGGHPPGRRDQPRPHAAGARGPVPRGPLLPHQRDDHLAAAAARPPRGHPGTRRSTSSPATPPARVPPAPRLSPDALELLVRHDWPGNVRELENVTQGAVQFCTDGIVTADQLGNGALHEENSHSAAPSDPGLPTLRDKMEEYIQEVLGRTGGNLTQAARILGVTRRTLQRMNARRRVGSIL